jgi:hypothetical protein
LSRLEARGASSCQYALFLLRWLQRAPEDFLTAAGAPVGETRLPSAGPEHRLRWNLAELHAAVNAERTARSMTWTQLAAEIGCTPARLTNLRTATIADMELVVRITQWLARPAAAFIHPAAW